MRNSFYRAVDSRRIAALIFAAFSWEKAVKALRGGRLVVAEVTVTMGDLKTHPAK